MTPKEYYWKNKAAMQEASKRWYDTHRKSKRVVMTPAEARAKRLEQGKARYHRVRDKILARRKELYIANIATAREKRRNAYYRLRDDPEFRVNRALRRAIQRMVECGAKKQRRSCEYLGASFDDVKSYLESRFLPGMSWDNYGPNGWHIDHIKPIASFDLLDPEQVRQAAHYTNLQPLWALDNLCKGAKIA